MKITAAKFVNARVGSPQTSMANPFYISPGDVIDVQTVAYGTSIDGNAIWYKDTEGYFYWSGGFIEEGLGLKLFDPAPKLNSETLVFQKLFLISLLPDYILKYDDAEYVGVSIGEIDTDSLAIIIAIPPNKPIINFNRVEKEILYKGYMVPVKIENTPKFKPNLIIYQDKKLPLVMGGTVENMASNTIGTRGLKLDFNGKVVILTCYHVGCYNLMEDEIKAYSNTNINIRIPAKDSSSTVPPIYGNIISGRIGGFYDYSLIGIPVPKDISADLLNDSAPTTFYSALEANSLKIGDAVISYGCITGKSHGRITHVYITSSYITVEYDHIGDTRMYGMIVTTKMSEEGDSGAAVLDNRNKVIGIIIASNDDYSLIMPFFRLSNIHSLKLLPS